MDTLRIIEKYYKKGSKVYTVYMNHVELVRKKALEIASNIKYLNPDIKFIEEASMLHDIGVVFTNYPKLGFEGKEPYIKHGVIGRELLEKEGLKKHALVCERHVGVGISKDDIIKENLPLPLRDMIPETLEEKIICIADKFYSKSQNNEEKTIEDIKREISRFGKDKLKRLEEWLILFKIYKK